MTVTETVTTRLQQLQAELRAWQRQHDLLLWHVRARVIELEQLGGMWPSVPVASMMGRPHER